MQSIEVSEKILPQIRIVFQGLRGIVYGTMQKFTPTSILPHQGGGNCMGLSHPFPKKAEGLRARFPSPGGRGLRGGG